VLVGGHTLLMTQVGQLVVMIQVGQCVGLRPHVADDTGKSVGFDDTGRSVFWSVATRC